MKSLKYEHTHEEWEAEGTKRISKKKKIYTNRNRIPRTRRRTCSRFFFSVHGEVNAFKWNLILVSPILCHGCCFFYFEWKNKIVKLALLVIAKKRKHKNSKTAKEESERELVAVCCQNLAWHTVRYKSTEPPNLRSILTQVWEKNEQWTCFNSSVGIEV